MSADHCWQSCCCFTTAEKLAWAKDNGIEPDASRSEHRPHAGCHGVPSCETPECNGCPSCVEEEVEPCCCHEPTPVTVPPCCVDAKKKTVPVAPPTKPESPHDSPRVQWVVGAMASTCQGHGPLTLQTDTPALPATPPFQPDRTFVAVDIVHVVHDSPPLLTFPPPIPPPRSA